MLGCFLYQSVTPSFLTSVMFKEVDIKRPTSLKMELKEWKELTGEARVKEGITWYIINKFDVAFFSLVSVPNKFCCLGTINKLCNGFYFITFNLNLPQIIKLSSSAYLLMVVALVSSSGNSFFPNINPTYSGSFFNSLYCNCDNTCGHRVLFRR